MAVRIWSTRVEPSCLPQWPRSPLALVLSALLVLIPPPNDDDDAHAMDETAAMLRRAYSELYARSALQSLENGLESSEFLRSASAPDTDRAWGPWSLLHANVPLRMEPVLALGLLGMYEYCQRGNVAKMRVRANQALTTAMDLGLHLHRGETAAPECLDAQRRGWWLTMLLVYHSSILNASSPVITINDPRITTPFPIFRGCREPWSLLMRGQETLLKSSSIARQLARDNRTRLSHSLGDEILQLDLLILDFAAEADRFRCVTNQEGAEADASRTLWAFARAIIHTSRVELHRFRAFKDHAPLLGEFTLINGTMDSLRPLSASRTAEIDSFFPFTQQESARVCLKSALVVSRTFRHLVSPSPCHSDTASEPELVHPMNKFTATIASPRSLPYMACCELQSFHALVMLLSLVRTAVCLGDVSRCYYLLDRPEPATEVGDAERLIEELRQAADVLGASIRADMVFGEVERAYEATWPF